MRGSLGTYLFTLPTERAPVRGISYTLVPYNCDSQAPHFIVGRYESSANLVR